MALVFDMTIRRTRRKGVDHDTGQFLPGIYLPTETPLQRSRSAILLLLLLRLLDHLLQTFGASLQILLLLLTQLHRN